MRLLRSIRWRLVLWYGALLALVLTGLGVTAYLHEKTSRLGAIDLQLQSHLSQLAGALHPGNHDDGGPPSPGRRKAAPVPVAPAGSDPEFQPPKSRGDGDQKHHSGKTLRLTTGEAAEFVGPAGLYYAVRPKNSPLYASANAPAGIDFPIGQESGVRTRDGLREAFLFPAPGDCVLVGIPLAPLQAALWRYLGLLVAVGLAVLVVTLAGGWLLITRALRPIHSITAAVGGIAMGDLSRRVDVSETESELGGVAGVLNETFARLEHTFEQQARFTADAAHELRTPVTVILTHAQNALDDGDLNPDQREALEAVERAAQRMRHMIESLLQLARLDAGRQAVGREPTELGFVTYEAVELLRTIAAKRNTTVTTNLEFAMIRGDAVAMGQVVANLVNNAIHHGRENGAVRVAVRSEKGYAVLEVTDDGPGIPAEQAVHIFDRFYRVDAVRTGTAGRNGLGLAISKAIVEAHGGTIAVQSREGAGATFTVRLPDAKF